MIRGRENENAPPLPVKKRVTTHTLSKFSLQAHLGSSQMSRSTCADLCCCSCWRKWTCALLSVFCRLDCLKCAGKKDNWESWKGLSYREGETFQPWRYKRVYARTHARTHNAWTLASLSLTHTHTHVRWARARGYQHLQKRTRVLFVYTYSTYTVCVCVYIYMSYI